MRSACFSWALPVRRRIWNELLCDLTTYGCGLRWCTTFFCCCINFTDTTASPLQLSLKSPSSSRVFHRRSACAAVCNVLPWTLAKTLCARLLHLHVTSCFVPVDHDRQRPCQTWSDLGHAQRGLSLIFLLFLFHVRAPYPSPFIQSPRGCCNTGGVCCTSTCTRVRTHGSRTHGSRSRPPAVFFFFFNKTTTSRSRDGSQQQQPQATHTDRQRQPQGATRNSAQQPCVALSTTYGLLNTCIVSIDFVHVHVHACTMVVHV